MKKTLLLTILMLLAFPLFAQVTEVTTNNQDGVTVTRDTPLVVELTLKDKYGNKVIIPDIWVQNYGGVFAYLADTKTKKCFLQTLGSMNLISCDDLKAREEWKKVLGD